MPVSSLLFVGKMYVDNQRWALQLSFKTVFDLFLLVAHSKTPTLHSKGDQLQEVRQY